MFILFRFSGNIGLNVNEEKTKFIVLSKIEGFQPNLQMENFKCLTVNINNKRDGYQEIKERISSFNKCYHRFE